MLTLTNLRALKGAPLSIIIAMMIARQKVGEGWLISMTGYSQNTIRTAMKFLLETQIVIRIGRYDGYTLSEGVTQLPLETNQISDPGESKTDSPVTVTTTTTFNKKDKRKSEEKEAVVIEGESKIDSRLQIIYDAGIREPTASRLIKLAWVDEEYLKNHIEKANKDKTQIGLLIHRIRSHDPMPKKEFDNQDPNSYRRSWLGVE